MRKKIVFTGGGTAGHVTPNTPLMESLAQSGWQVEYMGSAKGVEKAMMNAKEIPFHAVNNGKLRRYFSWQTFVDPFRILIGILQAYRILRKLKPDVVFSKGGFVAFPVVVGAWLNRIPIVAHESDMSPGLANRLCFPFVDKICLTFASAKKYFKKQEKIVVTGTPLRKALFQGSQEKALYKCGFDDSKPCLLVIGGSQGANVLNACVRASLEELCKHYQIIHLCGKGKLDKDLDNQPGYFQMEYAKEELADFFAASEFVISRAGANALYEILALNKPHILIPLSQKASRGDQIENAHYFQQKGASYVISEENLTPDTLLASIKEVNANRLQLIARMQALNIQSATDEIVKIIKQTAHC